MPNRTTYSTAEWLTSAGELIGSAGPEPTPEVALTSREDRSAIEAAVAALDPMERAVIVLAYGSGLSQSEIAARLDWPIGTVKTRTRRALRRLRDRLEETHWSAGAPGDRHCSPGDPESGTRLRRSALRLGPTGRGARPSADVRRRPCHRASASRSVASSAPMSPLDVSSATPLHSALRSIACFATLTRTDARSSSPSPGSHPAGSRSPFTTPRGRDVSRLGRYADPPHR